MEPSGDHTGAGTSRLGCSITPCSGVGLRAPAPELVHRDRDQSGGPSMLTGRWRKMFVSHPNTRDVAMRQRKPRWHCLLPCIFVILSDAALVQARPAASFLQARAVAISNNSITCAPVCEMSRRGRIYCPNFLTTPDHWPCVGYKMSWSPCIGWHLEAVFMCP
jgi:hypothetical protein